MVTAVRFARAALGVSLLVATLDAQSQQRALTVDDIYHPERGTNFSGAPEIPVTWLDPDAYVTTRRAGRGIEWLRVDADTGRSAVLFDVDHMHAALQALPGVTREEATLLSSSRDLQLNPARSAALVTIADDLYVYDFESSTAARLTATRGDEEEPSFSPDGGWVAFVRDNDLYVVDVGSQRERRLTTDGGPLILNGKLDWLYQEEIYGRGEFRGYWWSPDSMHVAFLQLDERGVPEYTIVDDVPYRPALEVTPYPKAGDPNPAVKLGIGSIGAGVPRWIDLGAYEGTEILIVNVGWTPDSDHVVHHVQDREQTWLDLNLADASTGRARRLLRETTPAWVNEHGGPIWLEDGSFLWFSERTGFKHLYRYDATGTTGAPVTTGRWDVATLYGIDETTGLAYFASSRSNAVGADIFRVGLDGSGLARVSQPGGTHRAVFNPDFTRYVDVWSDATTPTQVRLHRSDGSLVRVIDPNAVSALARVELSRPQFVEVGTRDGGVMNGMLIKPPNFDPARRYPVYQFTYAGPGGAIVRDQWGGSQYMFHQLLAQHGVLVWILDNRSTMAAESQWRIYGRLGEFELEDLEDGITWLKRQSFVDPSRIVLSGWSYGAFMAAYALTHSNSWSAGIVGAPVTDWRDYDTIYTERLMQLPSRNPDGYRETAPRFAAERLRGQLLLIHGTMDDNVHIQNSMQFAYELQKAGRPFEMMVYPKSRHGLGDGRLNTHLRQLMLDFVMRAVTPNGEPLEPSR